MRTLVLILMLALLPLRMWAADGMAIRMATPATERVGTGAEAMPADCPFMAADLQGDRSEESQGTAATCQACQLCAALVPQADFGAAPAAGPQDLAPAIASTFQSALAPREHKPPIS